MKTGSQISLPVACALLVVAAAGCAKKAGPQFDLVPVSGIVKVDGQPVAEATVAYYFEGTPPTNYYGSAGTTDSQGRYELRTGEHAGAVPGTYKITVSRITGTDGKPVVLEEGIDIEQLRRQGGAAESIAPRYSDQAQTELKVTVEKGKADGYDLELKSG